MVVQDGAFLYRKQIYNHSASGALYYQNKDPFDDVIDKIIFISSKIKHELKEYIQKKLFNTLLFPRLILRSTIPSKMSMGKFSFQNVLINNKSILDEHDYLGNRHSSY